jgi:hypothetical protein
MFILNIEFIQKIVAILTLYLSGRRVNRSSDMPLWYQPTSTPDRMFDLIRNFLHRVTSIVPGKFSFAVPDDYRFRNDVKNTKNQDRLILHFLVSVLCVKSISFNVKYDSTSFFDQIFGEGGCCNHFFPTDEALKEEVFEIYRHSFSIFVSSTKTELENVMKQSAAIRDYFPKNWVEIYTHFATQL